MVELVPYIFISFPITNRISLIAGETNIDFEGGIAITSNSTSLPTSHRISQLTPLHCIFFENDQDIEVDISYNGKIQYTGIIPSGTFPLKNLTFDHVKVTTAVTTNLFIIASTAPEL